jgi:hypothetical protein
VEKSAKKKLSTLEVTIIDSYLQLAIPDIQLNINAATKGGAKFTVTLWYFVHLITRGNKYKDRMEFDHERANRIHWVKAVLLNHTSARVKYFEYADEKGILKHHYWLEEENFIVVLKPVQPDLMVVAAFCIDDYEKARYRKRYNDFRNGQK